MKILENELDIPALKKRLALYCPEITHPFIDNLRPFSSREDLCTHFNRLDEIKQLIDSDGPASDLSARPVTRLTRLEISNLVLDEHELYGLMVNLRVAADVQNVLNSNASYPHLSDHFQDLDPCREVYRALRKALNDDMQLKDSASPLLSRLRREQRSLTGTIDKFYQNFFKKNQMSEMIREELITVRNNRKVVMIKKEFKNMFPGVIHDESASKESVFMEPIEALSLNNKLRETELEEEKEVLRIKNELTGLARTRSTEVLRNQQLLAYWELLAGLASYMNHCNAIVPVISEKKKISVSKAVHPLLSVTPVPLELKLGEEPRILILSGPNAGGKTVALKTMGMFSYLALSGLPLTAASAEIGWFSDIFIDIGDKQSIENNLSTFSSHLVRIRKILDRCTSDSLVLVDEIGVGSSPDESQALACALVEELKDKGCMAVVTTHYRQVIDLAEKTDEMCNAGMNFDLVRMEPTYMIKYGEAGFSFGLVMAEKYGLPRNVIKRAEKFVEFDFLDYQEKARQVNERLSSIEKMKNATKTELEKAEKLRTDLQKELAELTKKKKNKIRELLSKKEAEINRIIDRLEGELKQVASRKGKGEHLFREQVKEVKQKISMEKQESLPAVTGLEQGMTVRVRNMKNAGKILRLEREEVIVSFGRLNMRCSPEDIVEVIKKPDSGSGSYSYKGIVEMRTSFRSELVLVGMRAEDAIEKVRSHISDAIALGEKKIFIIHGIGEMILRNMIWDYLKQDRNVRRFYEAPLGDGGRAKTICEL